MESAVRVTLAGPLYPSPPAGSVVGRAHHARSIQLIGGAGVHARRDRFELGMIHSIHSVARCRCPAPVLAVLFPVSIIIHVFARMPPARVPAPAPTRASPCPPGPCTRLAPSASCSVALRARLGPCFVWGPYGLRAFGSRVLGFGVVRGSPRCAGWRVRPVVAPATYLSVSCVLIRAPIPAARPCCNRKI